MRATSGSTASRLRMSPRLSAASARGYLAEQAESDEQRRRLLSFAIVGGGVTGAEVAAELLAKGEFSLA